MAVVVLITTLCQSTRIQHPEVRLCSQMPHVDNTDFVDLVHVNDNRSVDTKILAASAWVFESGVVMMRRSLQYDDDHRKIPHLFASFSFTLCSLSFNLQVFDGLFEPMQTIYGKMAKNR